MRKFLLLSTLLVSPALGADLPYPVKTSGVSPLASVAYDAFSGIYLGVNGGYGWNLGTATAGSIVQFGDFSIAPQGFIGGVQAGYGQRVGSLFYLGVEGDLDVATLTGTSTLAGVISATSKNTWMGSIRGRVGFIPVGHAMIYGTAGYGFGSSEFTISDLATNLTAISKPTVTGLVWGGGLEVPFSANWLGRVEYLQYDFGTLNNTLEGVNFSTKDRVDVIRAGLNYKF